MQSVRLRGVIGLVWMAAWALVSLVVVAINNADLREDDSTLFLPFMFPGFLVPGNLGPIDLWSSDAYGSIFDFLFTSRVGAYRVADLLPLALLVVSVMALVPALRASPRTLVRVAWILGAVHAVVAFNVAFFDVGLYSEVGTYAVGAAVLTVGVVLTVLGRPRGSSAPSAAPAPAASASGATRQFVVQTATGSSDWLTWDQLVWMAQNGHLQPTTMVFDGARQVTTPASSFPGLFSS